MLNKILRKLISLEKVFKIPSISLRFNVYEQIKDVRTYELYLGFFSTKLKKPFTVVGDGTQTGTLQVSDVVEVMLQPLNQYYSEIINIGSDNTYSVNT